MLSASENVHAAEKTMTTKRVGNSPVEFNGVQVVERVVFRTTCELKFRPRCGLVSDCVSEKRFDETRFDCTCLLNNEVQNDFENDRIIL
jgi:hypothetical protein